MSDRMKKLEDAAEMLWVVLANVNSGDWTQQPQQWQEAAARWRDNYFAVIHEKPLPDGGVSEEHHRPAQHFGYPGQHPPTVAVTNGLHLIEGIQLRERRLTPKWFGRLVIWIFFHRIDTRTEIRISGLADAPRT